MVSGRTKPQHLWFWAKNGSFAILDQGLFAGTNFLVNILLARWLEPAQYGAFALAYSLFLLLGAFHTAILTEPMMVFGSGKYAGRFHSYLGILIFSHVGLMIPLGILLAAAAFLTGYLYSPEVQSPLLGLALAGPMILLLWLVRRAFYVSLRPAAAALGGGLYALFFFGGLYLLWLARDVTPTTAFLGMGVSALLVALFFLRFLRPQWRMDDPMTSSVAADHWRYGRWSLGTAGLMWIPGNIYFVLLPVWLGLDGVAALRALINLATPVMHAIVSLVSLAVPILTPQMKNRTDRLPGAATFLLGLFLAGSVAYLIGLIAFRDQVLGFFYGEKYGQYSSLVPLVGLWPLGVCLSASLGSILRAMERPDGVFWCHLASSGVTVAAGVALAATYGVGGALAGLLLSSFTTAIAMFFFYRSVSKRDTEETPVSVLAEGWNR